MVHHRAGEQEPPLRDVNHPIEDLRPRLEDNSSLRKLLKSPWETRVLNPQSLAPGGNTYSNIKGVFSLV